MLGLWRSSETNVNSLRPAFTLSPSTSGGTLVSFLSDFDASASACLPSWILPGPSSFNYTHQAYPWIFSETCVKPFPHQSPFHPSSNIAPHCTLNFWASFSFRYYAKVLPKPIESAPWYVSFTASQVSPNADKL